MDIIFIHEIISFHHLRRTHIHACGAEKMLCLIINNNESFFVALCYNKFNEVSLTQQILRLYI